MAEPNQVYNDEDGQPSIRPNLHIAGQNNTDRAPAQPLASATNLDDYRQEKAASKTPNSLSPSELSGAETARGTSVVASGAASEAKSLGASSSGNETDEGGLFHQEKGKTKKSFLRGKVSSGLNSNKKKKLLFGGLGLSGVAGLIVILIIVAGALKVIHFSQVLITSGYARLNGITQERVTQDLFDASIVEGPGTATISNRTLLDRLTFRNVELELAKIGRDGNFALINDAKGNTTGFRINDKTVDVNDISQQLFHDNYADIGPFKKLTVRKTFTDQAQNLIADEFSTESRV